MDHHVPEAYLAYQARVWQAAAQHARSSQEAARTFTRTCMSYRAWRRQQELSSIVSNDYRRLGPGTALA